MISNHDTNAHQARATNKAYWQSRTRRLVIIINACWLLTWALNLLTLAAVLYIVLGVCRVGVRGYWISISVISAIGVLFLLRRVRDGTLMTWRDGLVLLEDRLSLESALSSAQDGAVDWPAPQKGPRLFQPRMQWVFLPVLAWGIAWQVPRVSASSVSLADEMPNRAKELKETINTIEEQQLVDPEELDKLKQNMDDFAAQGPQEWFTHESMEAMDALSERLEAAVDANKQALTTLEESVTALKSQPAELATESGRDVQENMDKALGALSTGALPLDPQLMKQLQQLSNPDGASDEGEKAMQALKGAQKGFESLKKKGEGGKSEQKGENNGSDTPDGGSGKGNDGSSQQVDGASKSGNGTSKDGDKAGGGVSRGPGEAPLNLFEKPPSMTSQLNVELESNNVNIDTADEVVGVIRRAPQVLAPAGRSAGEEISSQDEAAATTWKDSLTPDEEKTIKEVLR